MQEAAAHPSTKLACAGASTGTLTRGRAMYRIEVKPGEETVFRTIEELATGIRNGFITPRARIFHAASQKWLPIEFHPHYKKALEGDYTPAPVASPPSLSAFPTPVLTPVPARAPSPHASPVMAMRAEVES